MRIDLILCLLVAVILMICILIIRKQYLKLKRSYDAILTSYRNLEELNSTLRVQRHDYLNHLQVIYGMMELEEYTELKSYLDPLYKDMMKTGKALKTSKPAVNALIRAKSSEADLNTNCYPSGYIGNYVYQRAGTVPFQKGEITNQAG